MPSSPRMRRRVRSFRGLFLMLIGIFVGLLLPRPWQGAPSPVVVGPAAQSAPPQRAAVAPLAPSVPRIVAADAPPQAPWEPINTALPASKAPTQKPLAKATAAPAKKTEPQKAPSRTEAGFISYVVKPGDTFVSIAKRLYGHPEFAGRLVKANPEINPRALPLGRAIRVPLATAVSTASPTPKASTRPAKPVAVKPSASPKPSVVRSSKAPASPSPRAQSSSRYQPRQQPTPKPVTPRKPRATP
ncbi:MAG: LysM peptidoglycan-binding domain-containing protein [Candidatus Sericytochromatia bacterium]|nr:LysM peptidoglycan-binding domain-containing protein [Candidatus Sericytochromatia bacterium]